MDDPTDTADTGAEVADEEPVSFEMDIVDGETRIVVSGDRDTAVVVVSASGEKIYLPPEDFERSAIEGRQTPYDSPYQSRSGSGDSPYDSHPDATSVSGLEPTADGYIIQHPEPVQDVRFLR
ncbi:hypothetical protein ACFQJ5_12215 [Halomicroarcula sp. GCM10025324]|uniref:DUF7510 family protein n=1 Tax=Haloarcula TaxID=2237 RepID=UPI0023E8DE84|nr:hypothetical protein [Halomicroarcula sp. ZS-22-S1]